MPTAVPASCSSARWRARAIATGGCVRARSRTSASPRRTLRSKRRSTARSPKVGAAASCDRDLSPPRRQGVASARAYREAAARARSARRCGLVGPALPEPSPRSSIAIIPAGDRDPTPAELLEQRLAALAESIEERRKQRGTAGLVEFDVEGLSSALATILARIGDAAQISIHIRD